MNIATLFNNNEKISIEAYLQKCGISDIDEFIKPTGEYIESPDMYDGMREGYELIKEIMKGCDVNVSQEK